MKRILLPLALVLGVLLCSLSGCKSLGPTPPPGTPGFVSCSETTLHQAELGILPAVETALASANWEGALLSIVAGIGGPLALAEVNCVVTYIESEAAKASTATADSIEAAKVSHAAAWLLKYPANITP